MVMPKISRISHTKRARVMPDKNDTRAKLETFIKPFRLKRAKMYRGMVSNIPGMLRMMYKPH